MPEIDIRNRRTFVSPKTRPSKIGMAPISRKALGIRLDFRNKLLSAKLSALRNEEKTNNASPVGLVMLPPVPITCAMYRLPKSATALENNQIYTVRVFICITTRQIEKITSSPIRRY